MRKEDGSIGDFLAVCVCMLLMSVLLISYIDSVGLIHEKAELDQIARKYILRMETNGTLTERDRAELCAQLEQAGATEITLEGTSMTRVPYGETITLQIRGKLRGEIAFHEKRISTAKY